MESFGPSPFYYDEQFLTKSGRVVEGPLFTSNFTPNIRKLAENGISFSGMSSQSLPTYGGFHSLITGDPPLSIGTNVIESVYNDLDDLPSSAKHYGYQTIYISCCDFDFDGKHNWIFRGNFSSETPTQLTLTPAWFDKVVYQLPTPLECSRLGVPRAYKYWKWTSDRVTSTQLKLYFHQ